MAAPLLPTAAEIRANLPGYNITASVFDDPSILSILNNIVVPAVNRAIQSDLTTTPAPQVVEYYSGNGTQTLFLNRRFINTLVRVRLVSSVTFLYFLSTDAIQVVPKQGILKIKIFATSPNAFYSFFPKGEKNLEVTYTYGLAGVIPADIFQALLDLCCVEILQNMADRTGGGNLSTQGFSRNYGDRGKYTNAIIRLNNRAMAVLQAYRSYVSGS